jgi:hypothetical protein
MPEPRIKMGRVGDRTPPPGLVKDLKGFDPALRLNWSVGDQCWVIAQKVKRNQYVGEWNGITLSETREEDRVVLYLTDVQGEPDRRIFPQLYRQRIHDRAARKARMQQKQADQNKAKKDRMEKEFDPARERMENSYYDLRSKGFGDSVRPVYVPGDVAA